jgi:hypothetical protein
MSKYQAYELSRFYYFESSSMKELYKNLQTFQNSTPKHFLSLDIQIDQGKFCCILLADSHDVGEGHLTRYEEAMDKFQRKALKRIGIGVNFSDDAIKPQKILDIQMKLKECKSEEDVKRVFYEAFSDD